VIELKGCVAHGEDEAEALTNLKSMMALWIESALEDGREIPQPAKDEDSAANGKLLVRTSRSVHVACIKAAAEDGISLNQWVVTVLSKALGFREGKVAGVAEMTREIAVPSTKAFKRILMQVAVAKSWQMQTPGHGADPDFIESLVRVTPTHYTSFEPLSGTYEKEDKHRILH
jgi:antitoxin HicB